MATPLPNIFGMERLTGEAVSQPKVSQAVRRLLLESQRATQINNMLVDELASGVLSSGAAQQVGREMQKNQSIARFNSRMAAAKNAEEQATKGRGAAIAQSLIGATGTLAAQYISSDPGETGDATVAGMDKAFEETISPGDLTVPGGAAARLQAQAARQAERSQFGVPALTVDPSVLAAQGRVGSVQAIDPMAPAGATLPSVTGEYAITPQALEQARLRQAFVNQAGLTGQLPDYTAPESVPAMRGQPVDPILNTMSPDLRDETLAIQPRPAESGFGAAGVEKAEPQPKADLAQLISDAMALKDKEEQRKALRKIMQQYGDGMGGE